MRGRKTSRKLCFVALALSAWTACKGNDKSSKPSAAELDRRCEQLAAACGDKDKHVDKILDACHQAAAPQASKGCAAKAVALYDCYEKQVCGASEKVWALDDLRVLAGRKNQCKSEHEALDACMGTTTDTHKGSAK